MKEDFSRLLSAARQSYPKSISTVADLGRFLGESDQTMHNWSVRGLPKTKILALAERVRCDAKWLMNGDGQISANYQYRAVAIAETGAEQMSPGSYLVVAEPSAKNPYNPSAATSLSVSGRKLVSRLERLEAAGAASPQMYTAIEALLTMAEETHEKKTTPAFTKEQQKK